MNISIPELSLVVLIGPSGAGKSTFAHQHFLATEILSSDYCRALVSGDENDQAATNDAFEVLHFIAAKRLKAGKLTVIDATNVQPEARKPLVALARQYHCLPVALVLDMPEKICHERNQARPDRDFGKHVIINQRSQLHRSMRGLEREGFRHVHVFKSPEELVDLTIERQPLWNNKKSVTGPFDIIGDVHGCFDEAVELLEKLGYQVDRDQQNNIRLRHPENRKAVFVGDLVDRGPKTPEVIRLVMGGVESGAAFCVAGNHDVKLVKALRGRDVKRTHGLAESLAQLAEETEAFRKQAADFLDKLVSHYVFDQGKLVVAHAGLQEEMHGRGSGRVREFAQYGETTGETDEFGLPIRYNWAQDYRGRAMVVYVHTPVPEAEWLNNTICLDTGCVFGGKLTALRYPEKELVSVTARQQYYEPIRPIAPAQQSKLGAQQQADDILDLTDVTGKRIIETSLAHNVTIREENSIAALEVMSRFAANPKWLIYLPPTMSPSETSLEPGFLEYPREVFMYYRNQGASQVVCQEKHMGSRAVVIVCRDEAAVRQQFGITNEGIGIVYTRTGRRFFSDATLEQALLTRLGAALNQANFWQEFQTDWFCFDCELMPWSIKAQDLLYKQYAPVGTASKYALSAATTFLQQAEANVDVTALRQKIEQREALSSKYIDAYRRYCWPVNSVDDLKLAPFHLLASAGKTYFDQNHLWHMQSLTRLAAADPALLIPTQHRQVNLENESDIITATQWWLGLTEAGGEGMVVKPFDFIAKGKRGLMQPAIKCRGREYLRIIYGPEYTLPEHLERLRERGLSTKRRLAHRDRRPQSVPSGSARRPQRTSPSSVECDTPRQPPEIQIARVG